MPQYDVVIVGGGLVGATLAHALARSKLKIALLDLHSAEKLYTPALDNRGLALSYISTQLLAKINIWSKISAEAYPMQTIHVSRQGKFGFTKLKASRLGLSSLGYVVPASSLGGALIRDIPGSIDVLRPIDIKSFCYNTPTKEWQLMTDRGSISAKLLVGADGTNSTVRSRAGIQNLINAANQSAIVANIEVEDSVTTAYERFTSSGVLAVLPFGERRVKSVFTAKNVVIDSMLKQGVDTYKSFVNNMLGMRIGRFVNISKPMVFPIQEVSANSVSAPGVVLLGNAANTLHPVAAQGFNLGLRDAITLAEILNANDIYDVPNIYAKRRVYDHSATKAFTSSLLKLPAALQSISILAAQFIPVVNTACARRGLGSWI